MAKVHVVFPETVLFTQEIPVRITDLNYGNHLAHDRLISILHEARARFLRAFDLEEVNCGGAGIILVDLAVRYKAQAFFGQVLRIEMAAGDVGSRGCDLFYRVRDQESNTEVALAKTGVVFFDYARQKVVEIPDPFRRILKKAD